MRRLVHLALLAIVVSGHAQTESLLLGPGDQVHVQVFDTPDLDERTRVTDEGEISLVLGGSVKVAGKTPAVAAHIIEKVLHDGGFINDPHVLITVEQYATQGVTVSGQVKNPGNFPIGTKRSVLDLLSMAGGLTDVADRHITIQRRSTGEMVEYFVSNDADVALRSSIDVYPGDRIIVPRAAVVYVLGDVGRPGGFAKATNDDKVTVLQVMSMAGGIPPTAKTSKARLIRKQPNGTYVVMPLHLGDIQDGKRADFALNADDIIYVPFSYLKNIYLGIGGILSAATSATIYTVH